MSSPLTDYQLAFRAYHAAQDDAEGCREILNIALMGQDKAQSQLQRLEQTARESNALAKEALSSQKEMSPTLLASAHVDEDCARQFAHHYSQINWCSVKDSRSCYTYFDMLREAVRASRDKAEAAYRAFTTVIKEEETGQAADGFSSLDI